MINDLKFLLHYLAKQESQRSLKINRIQIHQVADKHYQLIQ